jgi:hypothetical protein
MKTYSMVIDEELKARCVRSGKIIDRLKAIDGLLITLDEQEGWRVEADHELGDNITPGQGARVWYPELAKEEPEMFGKRFSWEMEEIARRQELSEMEESGIAIDNRNEAPVTY